MEYITPDYFARFTCIGEKCPDTCCAGWQIMIDKRTQEKYKQVQGSFRNRLYNSIDWKEEMFRQYDRRCAFLNEENLCDIYKEIGPNMLCKTCRNYPRHTEEFEGVRELSLSLSCPEAARIVLEQKEPVTWHNKETKQDETYDAFDYFLYSLLCDTREVLFQILQDRSLSIYVRMALCLGVCQDVQKRIDSGTLFEVQELLERVKNIDKKQLWQKKRVYFYCEKARVFALEEQWMEQFGKLEPLRRSWSVFAKNIRQKLYADGPTDYFKGRTQYWKMQKKQVADAREIQLEQLMIYFLFTHFCGAVYDAKPLEKMKLSLFHVLNIDTFWYGIWSIQNGRLTQKQKVCLVGWYCREVEHSDENVQCMETFAQEHRTMSCCALMAVLNSREEERMHVSI